LACENAHQSSQVHHSSDVEDIFDPLLVKAHQSLLMDGFAFVSIPKDQAPKAIAFQWGGKIGSVKAPDLSMILLDQAKSQAFQAILNQIQHSKDDAQAYQNHLLSIKKLIQIHQNSLKPVDLIWHERHLAISRMEIEDQNHVGIFVMDDGRMNAQEMNAESNLSEISLHWQSNPRPQHLLAKTLEISPIDPNPKSSQANTIELGQKKLALAPYEFVVSRVQWGARSPELICSAPVQPYRASVHHTASPSDDGGDPALRMRQIQAFHMDTRGWCDIGYHFVVSQSGQIFEGRLDETRPGAHVGGENSGNIGVSMIGNFDVEQVSATQFNGLIRIYVWIHQTYQIPLDHEHIKGHQEWPNQSTSCPGANLLSRLDELYTRVEANQYIDMMIEAQIDDMGVVTDLMTNTNDQDQQTNQGNEQDQGNQGNLQDQGNQGNQNPSTMVMPIQKGISMKIEWMGEHADLNLQGQSLGIDDFFENTTIQARITLENHETTTYQQLLVGVEHAFDVPKFRVISLNGQILSTDDLTDEIFINQIDGKSKVIVDVGGFVPSYQGNPPTALKVWLKEVPNTYSQSLYDAQPSQNQWGDDLKRHLVLLYDTISAEHWIFKGPDDRDIEGWENCGTESAQSIQDGKLNLWGYAPCLASPSWTKIDSLLWKQIVFKIQTDGSYDGVLRFETDLNTVGEQPFSVPSAGLWWLVIDLSNHAQWQSMIQKLKFTLVPTAENAVQIENIFVQNQLSQTTSLGSQVPIESTQIIGSSLTQNQESQAPSIKDDGCHQSQDKTSQIWMILLYLFFLFRWIKIQKQPTHSIEN
jgi:hypothetical protein